MPLSQPPRDDDGSTIRHDHPGISAEDLIVRRIHEQYIVPDEKVGRRISTQAFRPSKSDGGMSVDLERLIVESGKDPRKVVTTPKWIGAVYFTAHDLREQEFVVGYDPVPNNPYHGLVWGTFTKSKQRNLQRMAKWYVPIPEVVLSGD
jgi:hypothetical protein